MFALLSGLGRALPISALGLPYLSVTWSHDADLLQETYEGLYSNNIISDSVIFSSYYCFYCVYVYGSLLREKGENSVKNTLKLKNEASQMHGL